MKDEKNFFYRLSENYDKLTKKQLKLADYIRKNYKNVVFSSCVPLAKNAGVSEATIVRFAKSLGYTGFTDMINDLQEYTRSEISMLERNNSLLNNSKDTNIIQDVILRSNNVSSSLDKIIKKEQIDLLLENIINCEKLVLIGFESGTSLVEYLYYHLIRMGINTELITTNSGDFYNLFNALPNKTMSISIGLPRYSNDQINITRELKQKNVKTFIITDSLKSPFFELGDYSILLPLKREIKSNFEIHIAILLLWQMIISEYSLRHQNELVNELEKLEEYNKNFDIFHSKLF